MERTAGRRVRRSVDPAVVVGTTAIAAGAVGVLASAAALVTGGGAPRSHRDGPEGERGPADQGSSTKKDEPRRESPSSRRERTAPSPDDPRKPEGPEDLTKRSWLFILKKVLREFGSDQCTDIAASLVYYAVLALFPGILAIVSILGLVGQGGGLTDALQGLPANVRGLLGPILTGATSKGVSSAAPLTLVIGIVGALFSASGFIGAFGRAMNRIYSIDEGRPVWKLRPTQLLITLAIVVLIVIGILILVLSGQVGTAIGKSLGLSDVVITVFMVVKWPVLLVIAVATIAILYYFSPNIRQPKFKWTSTGSIIALLVWAVATVGFGFYTANFGSYNKTYGSIAGIIIFLLWLWLTNLALLFGAEWDAELERGRELQAGIAAEEQIQLPPRDTRQSDKKQAKHEQDVAQAKRLRETRGRETERGAS